MTSDDELLDFVDDDDNVIGTVLRSEVMARKLCHFRVINAFIKNSRGEIWFPRRAAGKRIFPLCLDMSVGGHVGAGEPYDLAFARETEEETGIRLADVQWRMLGKMQPGVHKVSAFMTVYEIEAEAVPHYNLVDFTEFFWLTPAQLVAKVTAGDSAKGDLLTLVKHFYL